MLLNTKCERCNEPTKHVVGFWDGENGKSGFVHDCENEKCEVRQLIKVTETKAMQERFRIQNLNSRKRMYAGYIAALRKDAKISMMEMSKIAGCSPAEYSAYEHERKPFDEETYRKCEEYLLKNEKKFKSSGLSASERLLLLGPFAGEQKDWKELEWFSNKGYIVAYSDNHAEVPQEVIAVYNQINTPELQEKCRQLSWMRSCQSMMGLIYAIAPLKIVYRMYRKRDGFRVNYEKFMEILNELSEKDDICIIKGDKMIWKAVLQDNLYEKIEEFQGDRDFYIPTVEETLDYAKHGYPSQDVSYRKLASFLRDELHISEEKIEELLYIVYKEFSMDGMLSDIMEEFKKRDIVFDSDRQMERFAPIMMEVNNNTRMLDFRGYTPNEVSRAEQAAAPAPVAPAMPSFVPMANTPTVNMQPKKKVYPNDPCPCGSGKKYKKCCGRN